MGIDLHTREQASYQTNVYNFSYMKTVRDV